MYGGGFRSVNQSLPAGMSLQGSTEAQECERPLQGPTEVQECERPLQGSTEVQECERPLQGSTEVQECESLVAWVPGVAGQGLELLGTPGCSGLVLSSGLYTCYHFLFVVW